MNECIEVAELQLHTRLHVVLFHNLRHLSNDLKSVINGALMVICHLERKEVGKIELLGWGSHCRIVSYIHNPSTVHTQLSWSNLTPYPFPLIAA